MCKGARRAQGRQESARVLAFDNCKTNQPEFLPSCKAQSAKAPAKRKGAGYWSKGARWLKGARTGT